VESLFKLLKTPLYRILFNFPIGVIAFGILNWVLDGKKSLQIPFATNNLGSLGNLYWLIYITLAILIGEVVAFIGEIPVNALFGYNPIVPKNPKTINNWMYSIKGLDFPVELIAPNISANSTSFDSESNNQIFYSDFHDYEGTSSEIHFSMSRMLAGFGFEMYFISFLYFNIFNNSYLYCIPFTIAVITLYSVLFLYCSDGNSRKKLVDIVISFLITFIPLSIAVICINYKHISFFNYYKVYFTISFFILVSLFSYTASIYYRAHANKLTAVSRM